MHFSHSIKASLTLLLFHLITFVLGKRDSFLEKQPEGFIISIGVALVVFGCILVVLGYRIYLVDTTTFHHTFPSFSPHKKDLSFHRRIFFLWKHFFSSFTLPHGPRICLGHRHFRDRNHQQILSSFSFLLDWICFWRIVFVFLVDWILCIGFWIRTGYYCHRSCYTNWNRCCALL